MRRNIRDRDSPIYQDVTRGRGGIAGGLFTTNGTEGLEYDFYADYLQDETGAPIRNEGGGLIRL